MSRLWAHWKLLGVSLFVILFVLAAWLSPVAAILAVTAIAVVRVLIIPLQGRALFGGHYFPKKDDDYYREKDKSSQR